MTRMPSCYFCATALDEPAPRPVVPAALRGDETGPTVDLCSDCRPKLDAVVAAVVEATDVAVPATEEDDASAAAATGLAGDEAEADGADRAEADAGADPDGTDDAAVDTDESTDDADDSGGRDHPHGRTVDASEMPGITLGSAGEADQRESPGDEQADDAATAADGFDAGPAATDDTAPDAGRGDSGSDFEDVSVSRADFQRVVRLLQNREFPVAREEIQTVASSAYDIPPRTCGAVLDAAIDQGHVAEEDGHLVAPE
jgi:hypothetical protein